MNSKTITLVTLSLLALSASLTSAAQPQVPQAVPPTQQGQPYVATPPGGEPDCLLGIVPQWQKIDGRSYTEWGEAWWQWLVAFPPDKNPVLDLTGEYAGMGQSLPSYEGPMYFLTGTFGSGPVVRDITIPNGKYILVPIVNTWWDQYPGLWNPLNLPDPLSIKDLRAICAYFMDQAIVTCAIDGKDVWRPERFRFKTNVFSLMFDPEFATWYGYTTPYLRTAVGDGYFLIVKPLDPGQHVIKFTGEIPSIQFLVDVTYNITVEE